MKLLINFGGKVTGPTIRVIFLMILSPVFASGAIAATDNFLQNASGTYRVSPQTIVVDFSVGQLPIGAVEGRFHTVSGQFTLDGKNLKRSSVFLIIKPVSLKTNNPETDIYLRGPDFFNVSKFPDATFISTKIKRTGNMTAELTGWLQIKKARLPITFHVTFLKAQKDASPGKKFTVTFIAKGNFQRSKFGMTAGIPLFSDTVELEIHATGIKK